MASATFQLQQYQLYVYPNLCPPTPYFESFEFFETVLNVLAPFSLLFGLYGILVILKATPPEMKSAKWVVLYSHVATFYFGCTATILIRPFVYFPSTAIHATGLVLKIGIPFRYATWIAQTSYPSEFSKPQTLEISIFVTVQELSNVILFENRYSQISNFSKFTMGTKTRIVFFALHYIIFPGTFIIHLFSSPDTDSAKLNILKITPCPEHHFFLNSTEVMTTNQQRQSVISVFELIYLFSLASFFAAMSGYRLLYQSGVSKKTRDMQKKFLISLIIQVAVPFFILIIPFALYWICMMIGVVFPLIRSFIIFCVALHGITSGILLIFLHKPYRQFTFKLFLIRKIEPVKDQSKRLSIAPSAISIK